MNKRNVYIVSITVVLLSLIWTLRPERTNIDGLSGEMGISVRFVPVISVGLCQA